MQQDVCDVGRRGTQAEGLKGLWPLFNKRDAIAIRRQASNGAPAPSSVAPKQPEAARWKYIVTRPQQATTDGRLANHTSLNPWTPGATFLQAPCSCQPQQQSSGSCLGLGRNTSRSSRRAQQIVATFSCCSSAAPLLLLLAVLVDRVALLLSWTSQPSTAVSLSSVRARLLLLCCSCCCC